MKPEEYQLSTSQAAKAAAERAAARRAKLPSQQAHAAAQRNALFGNTYAQNYEKPGASAAIPDLSDPDNASVDELQAQTNKHQQAIEESQARMIKMAADATQTGAATLEQLHHQGEQLKNIQKDQAKIDTNLQTSDRILKGMESWGGAMRQWFSGKADKKAEGKKGAGSSSGDAGSSCDGGGASSGAGSAAGNPFGGSASGGNPFAGAQEQQGPKSADDEAMDRIASLVEGMHSMAHTMKNEIDKQSVEIDKTIDTADRQKDKLTNVTGRTKKVGGKGLFG